MQNATDEQKLTVREYARQEEITIQTAYRRIWDGKVSAQQFMGRWLISPSSREAVQPGKQKQIRMMSEGAEVSA